MGSPSPGAGPSRSVRFGVVSVLGALATLPLLVGTTLAGGAFLILPIVALSAGVAYALPKAGRRWVTGLALLSLAIAVASVASGVLNGLSDEPYSTPAYASLGLSMYTKPVAFSYVQYGVPHFERSYDVYLPMLTFIQIPGLDYRWVALSAWVGAALWVRRDLTALAGWSTPWIAVLAANGQNDFVPLFALSVALAVPPRRWGAVAEVVSLGLKQFANIIVVGFHLVRREYSRALVAGLVTFAFLVPFLWIDPGSVYCHVVLGSPTSTCAPHSAGFFLFKRNYWLYPTWVGLMFHRGLLARLRRVRASFAPAR